MVERVSVSLLILCLFLLSGAHARAGAEHSAPSLFGSWWETPKALWDAIIREEAERISEERRNNSGSPAGAPVTTPVASEKVVRELPTYDPDRVQKAAEEMIETIRTTRPSSWEDLAKVGGTVFNLPEGMRLPPFDPKVVNGAVENLASDISKNKPSSWEELNGMLQPYTKEIPAEVMQNVIANRLNKRADAEEAQDKLAKKDSGPADAGKDLSQAATAASAKAANQVQLFAQFAPPSMAAGGGLPAQSSSGWTQGVNSSVPSGPSRSGGARGFSSGTSPFNNGFGSGSGAPAPKETETKSAKPVSNVPDTPVAEVVGTEPQAKAAVSSDPAAAPAGSALKPSNLGQSAPAKSNFVPERPAGKPESEQEKKMPAAGPAQNSVYVEVSQPATSASAAAPTFSVNEPRVDSDPQTESENVLLTEAQSESSQTSATSSPAAYGSSGSGWTMESAQAFIRRWLLWALDIETTKAEKSVRRPRELASSINVMTGAAAANESFDVFDFWKISRSARHERIAQWGASVGLPPEKSLLLYHAALAAAWSATFAFAGYAAWSRREARRRRPLYRGG